LFIKIKKAFQQKYRRRRCEGQENQFKKVTPGKQPFQWDVSLNPDSPQLQIVDDKNNGNRRYGRASKSDCFYENDVEDDIEPECPESVSENNPG